MMPAAAATARVRIAIVSPNFPNSADPHLAIYNYHAARALQRWADVAVYCLIPSYPRYLFHPRSRSFRQVDSNFRLPGVDVHYVPYPAVPVLTRAFNGRTAARYLRPQLAGTPPNLILSQGIYPGGEGAVRVGAALGVPVIVQGLGSDLRMIADPFMERGTRNVLQRAALVLTVSDELRQRAVALGASPDKVQAILNGCDPELFRVADRGAARSKLGVPAAARLVLYVGRFDPVKNVDVLLEAAARLVPSQAQLQVACIGTGALETKLRALAQRLGLSPCVRWLGPRDPKDVACWLAAADLLCLPSRSEGCPNVVVEALACGRPVVASPVGGIPELVDDSCAVLTPPGDPAALAKALAIALDRDWDERRIAAHAGRSWDDVARETFEVCQRLLTRTGCGAA